MKQEARSERSRSQILAAALRLFSSQGYRGTNMREIAEAAGVSTGNVYHQFKDKEDVFQTLLTEYSVLINSPDDPFNKAIAEGAFPEDMHTLAAAMRQSMERSREHALLAYVDVLEFEGRHLRQFYENLTNRLEQFLLTDAGHHSASLVRSGVSALTAMEFTTRLLVKHFEAEVLFGITNHYGRDGQDVLSEMLDLLKHGVLSPRKI